MVSSCFRHSDGLWEDDTDFGLCHRELGQPSGSAELQRWDLKQEGMCLARNYLWLIEGAVCRRHPNGSWAFWIHARKHSVKEWGCVSSNRLELLHGCDARRGRCVLFQSTGNQLFLGEGDGAVQEASSVQFRPSVMSNSLWPHGLQQARLPCPSPSLWVYSNSCPLSPWCHPTISSSVIPFSSHLQSFPALGSFQMSQFFTSGGQSIGVSVSASVLPMNIQDWFPLGWTGWISLQSKGLTRDFSNTTVQKH